MQLCPNTSREALKYPAAGPLQRTGCTAAVVRHRKAPATVAIERLDTDQSSLSVGKGMLCRVCDQLAHDQAEAMTLRRRQFAVLDGCLTANGGRLQNCLRQGFTERLEEARDRNCFDIPTA